MRSGVSAGKGGRLFYFVNRPRGQTSGEKGGGTQLKTATNLGGPQGGRNQNSRRGVRTPAPEGKEWGGGQGGGRRGVPGEGRKKTRGYPGGPRTAAGKRRGRKGTSRAAGGAGT